jgi:hypothetical protein
MEFLLWATCLIGVNTISILLVVVAFQFRSFAKLVALAFPVIIPLFLLTAIRTLWEPYFASGKSVFFAVSMVNFFFYIYVWHRFIGRV